jgi:hypothetical protein
MTIASEPQIPCAHERLRASDESWYHFTAWRQSRRRSIGSAFTVYSSKCGCLSVSGL